METVLVTATLLPGTGEILVMSPSHLTGETHIWEKMHAVSLHWIKAAYSILQEFFLKAIEALMQKYSNF